MKKAKPSQVNKYYVLNERIRGEEFRVVDDRAAQVGILKRDEALALALEKELDLVLVSPTAKPPVVKLINFAKFKYQEQQKHATTKKSTKAVEIKEVRMTPFIAEGDYNNRIKQARRFLEAGNKVRINVKFVGRQITRKQFGQDLMNRVIADLADLSSVEREPNFHGKVLVAQLQAKR